MAEEQRYIVEEHIHIIYMWHRSAKYAGGARLYGRVICFCLKVFGQHQAAPDQHFAKTK